MKSFFFFLFLFSFFSGVALIIWRESMGSNRLFRRLRDSATASTGILFIFTWGCFLSEVVSRKNNLERHRVSCARDFVKITQNFDQHCDLVQYDAFACVTIYFQRSCCKMTDRLSRLHNIIYLLLHCLSRLHNIIYLLLYCLSRLHNIIYLLLSITVRDCTYMIHCIE